MCQPMAMQQAHPEIRSRVPLLRISFLSCQTHTSQATDCCVGMGTESDPVLGVQASEEASGMLIYC